VVSPSHTQRWRFGTPKKKTAERIRATVDVAGSMDGMRPSFARFRSLFAPSALTLAFAAACSGCAGAVPLPARAIELNREGAAFFEREELGEAEARFALALEYNPKFVEPRVNLGLVELRRGAFDRASVHLRKARSLNPDLPAPHHALGVMEERRLHFPKAEAHYEQALAVDPGFVPARLNLARLLFRRGAKDEAHAAFVRAVALAGDEVFAHVGRIECLLALARVGEASEALDTARERFGESMTLSVLRARVLLAEGLVSDARAALASLISETDPNDRSDAFTSALAWLAVADLEAHDEGAAKAHARLARARNPNEAVAAYVLGRFESAPGVSAVREMR